ncbi:MAG: mechanosensitive ion channel family protein [Halorhabdus sp.]
MFAESAIWTGIGVSLVVNTFTRTIETSIESAITQLPGAIGAAVVILVGYLLGTQFEANVVQFCEQIGIDEWVETSPIAALFDALTRSASWAIGSIVKAYVFLFSAFIAADIAAFQQLNPWLETLVIYVPNLLAGIVIIVIGIVVADYAARETRTAVVVEKRENGRWIPAVVRASLYTIVIIIGLDMIGINLDIVYLIVEGLTSALGLGIIAALALAMGIAGGFFARDYLDRHPRQSEPSEH